MKRDDNGTTGFRPPRSEYLLRAANNGGFAVYLDGDLIGAYSTAKEMVASLSMALTGLSLLDPYRPPVTDHEFICLLAQHTEPDHDVRLQNWAEGNWEPALEGLGLAEGGEHDG